MNSNTSYVSRRKRRSTPGVMDYMYVIFAILIVGGLMKQVESSMTPQPVVADYKVKVSLPTPTPKIIVKYVNVEKDARVDRLKTFLESRGSPLSPYAALIVAESDKNAVEWTLMVAISRKESGYGTNIRQGCYNPFGLGGTNLMCFKSWEEAIVYEAALLGNDYRYNSTAAIQEKYCPTFECAGDWSETVIATTREILSFK